MSQYFSWHTVKVPSFPVIVVCMWLQRKVKYSPYPTSPKSPLGFFPVQDLQRSVRLPFTVHVISQKTAPTAMSMSS